MLKLNTLSGFGSGVSGAAGTTYGYYSSGNANLGSPPCTVAVDLLTFSTGVTSIHTDSETSAVERPTSISDGGSNGFGYTTGGEIPGGGPVAATDRYTFSSGVIAVHTDADMTTATDGTGGFSDVTTYGYYIGGNI